MNDVIYKHRFFVNTRENFCSDRTKLPDLFNSNLIFKKIPKSIKTLRYHPLYTCDSLIKQNQIIFPRRPILGYFKGEPVFYKKNVQTLKSERG